MSMVLMVCCLLAGNGTKIVVFHLLQRQKTFFFMASVRKRTSNISVAKRI
jgi:hypothetical protein